ncbi:MAG TPA: prepilin peptidase, partial [Prosthecobacter sp.]|nr:prepilin peptidase [Prosthecobacter sp.]
MIQYQLLSGLLHFIMFFMGSAIGSFLNVVIYRLPLEISVNNPRRSFCPKCKGHIPFHHNIPILSWLLLRGKCAKCGAPISVRYIGVEVLTGVLFYAVFFHYSDGGNWRTMAQWGPQVLCLWLFLSLLVAGTFIDIDHFILPHEITMGGTVAGLICATAVPQLVGETTHLRALMMSFGSGAAALGALWLVSELGKLAFGRKRFSFDQAEPWSVTQPDEDKQPVLTLEKQTLLWHDDLFNRASDRLVITCPELRLNDLTWQNVTAELWVDKIKIHNTNANTEEIKIEDWKKLEGTTTKVVIPREAMGFGDALLLMMIGTFCGWKGVLFTIFAASVLGTVFAGLWRAVGKAEWSSKIPFGPYLAAGAV